MWIRRSLTALIFILLSASLASAQSDTDGSPFLLLTQGYKPTALSGYGPSPAFGMSVADLGGGNPAALGGFQTSSLGIAYSLETPIEVAFFSDIAYDPMIGVAPQSAGVAVPRGSYAFGVSYMQRYAAETDYGCILQTDDSEYCVSQTARVVVFSPQVAYRMARADGSELTLGLRVGFGYARARQNMADLASEFSDWGTQVAAGLSFRKPEAFGLAAFYESALHAEGKVMTEGETPPPPIQSPGGEVTVGGEITHAGSSSDAVPARLGVSADLAATSSLRIGADLTRVFWKAALRGGENLQDDTDAALWARLDVTERSLISFGLLSQGRGRWNADIQKIFGHSGRAIYLTLGGAVTFGDFRFDAVLADSHLLAASEQRQTILKVGASIGL